MKHTALLTKSKVFKVEIIVLTTVLLLKFGKVSLMSVVIQPSDFLQINRDTLKDKQSYLNFTGILNNCECKQCKNDNCHEQRIFTTTRESSIDESQRIRWQHRVSFSQVSFKITSRSSLSFIEIVIYVLGSISTWTGLSIMACNPATLARTYRKIRPAPRTSEINNRITTLQLLQNRTAESRMSQIEEKVNELVLKQQSSEQMLDYLKSKECQIYHLENRFFQIEQKLIKIE